MNIEVRYFAGIAQEIGTTAEQVEVPGDVNIDGLVDILSERHGAHATRQFGVCAFLVDGRVVARDAQLPLNAVVDVLPPFAGG
ncbi:MoaD/ThiS family protein [Arcanobacterium canis]|uniref:MoaD/ThiS family protein n=1 Tax=Arcanobacterium canis TaxID=999183 RepID=A0ABY8G081_9ACTO|nr:MoaD/ThiS family protein [Arcanobacterium canis]WFM84108.1 MoaD/ThiS family protein [Arcanobacterium canis]